MKRILIISYLFAPNNSIGSVRPTKLAKYLNKLGYTVDVISADLNLDYEGDLLNEIKYVNNLWVISEDKKPIPYRTIGLNDVFDNKDKIKFINLENKIKLKRNSFKFILMLKNMYRTLRSLIRSKLFVENFHKFINQSDFDGNKYDVVISTFGPIHSILCGMVFKRTYQKVTWICDFRDPMVVEEISPIWKPYFSYLQQKMCKKADIITTVSNGYLKRIKKGIYQEKYKVIPNGYDMDDYLSTDNIKNENMFSFTYVGSLYEGKRDLTPVFRVIRELIDEKVIDLQDINYNYAGNDACFFLFQAEKYNLGNVINNHGKLSRNDCLKLQFSSRFLLLSTWNNKKEEGVFPGKFLEYMLINKPIIAIIEGNLPNSEVRSVMNETNLGVSYESANSKIDYFTLKDYIKKQYERYKKGLSPEFNPNKEIIERYNWEKIVKQFEELF